MYYSKLLRSGHHHFVEIRVILTYHHTFIDPPIEGRLGLAGEGSSETLFLYKNSELLIVVGTILKCQAPKLGQHRPIFTVLGIPGPK